MLRGSLVPFFGSLGILTPLFHQLLEATPGGLRMAE